MSGLENNRYIVHVFVGALSQHYEALSVEAGKQTTAEEIVSCIVERLGLSDGRGYELAEVVEDSMGQECKERRLGPTESPVAVMLLWPKDNTTQQEYRFCLREKQNDCLWTESFTMDPQLIRDYFFRFLYQPKDREYPDLCQLPDLNEQTLLENLRARFNGGHIYTYVGSILIALNPFKFHPIYNPKYVKLYQNRRLGAELPPHIFAIADVAYHCMLKERRNQCVVISGESGSGKTESTNFLLHHLTALSQKGSHGSGVEQTILSAGPVLEAFGNAKTAHNNNSSRFGKFIQVNYKENGMVHGAVVQKYLLEKSRICSQGRSERNYHVFYYLLAGASDAEKQSLHLCPIENYHYLNRSGCYVLDNVDEKYEFSRLKQSMEMVGFSTEKQRRLFSVLSAVLLLGNIEFQPRKTAAYHHDEAVGVKNPKTVALISELLRVRQETLLAALTAKRARASGETLVINYRLPEAIAARDAMAKCLYGALFDWIVLQVNHALLSKKDTLREHQGKSIGVLDIFGFEDFGLSNSFEQFCINYANEHLQYYFNQHVFKYEQEEYRKEGIRWTDIEFMDNTQCLHLIEGKPNGLLCLLDDQCNFPGATNETLLQKFNSVHKEGSFYEIPQRRESAFIVRHYAGKVKYQVAEMREKNLDLMRQDIVGVLKNSSLAFVRELVGADPVAVFRWAIVRAFFRGYFAFHEAGKRHRNCRDGSKGSAAQNRYRNHTPNENLITLPIKHGSSHVKNQSWVILNYQQRNHTEDNEKVAKNCGHHRLSWPQGDNTQRNFDKSSTQYNESTHARTRRDSHGMLERVLCPDDAKVLELANQIVMKNRSFRPRERAQKGLKNLQTVKTLAGRTQSYGQPPGKTRKQPLTVTAQFQQSLHSLMDTLNQANPFFIRCIKSNSNKIPNQFDEETVQRQLRYTGMLETVRIRQAGYNVRLSYEEFIQLYRILLPKGLLSSQVDVRNFLYTLNLNRDNYQLGSTKVFLRESEKVKLDYRLHQQIMASIVTIQRWFRAVLERRRFIRLRQAVLSIQTFWRCVMAQRMFTQMRSAAIQIQTAWRSHKVRSWYTKLKRGTIAFQAHARGFLLRLKCCDLKTKHSDTRQVSNADAHSGQSTDEAFLSKESSQEELDEKFINDRDTPESEESSGIHEDSEPEEPVPPRRIMKSGNIVVVHNQSSDSRFGRREMLEDYEGNHRKKVSVKRTKGVKTETNRNTYQEIQKDSSMQPLSERKGSSDSLASMKSFESQRSSDSQSSIPVKDTLHKALQAIIGVGKKDKSDMGVSPPAQSDGEIEDVPHISITSSEARVTVTVPSTYSRYSESQSWRRGYNASIPSIVTGPTNSRVYISGPSDSYSRTDHYRLTSDSNRTSDSYKPTVKREIGRNNRLSSKPSSSQEDRITVNVDTPVRTARRQKGSREIVCRSLGEEISGASSVVDASNSALLSTIKESSYHTYDDRIAWTTQKEYRSSDGSESSYSNVFSSQEAEWSPVSPRVELSYPKSQLPVHVVATKRSRSGGIASLDLRRRNSDPANIKFGGVISDHPSGADGVLVTRATDELEWKGTQMFTIAGHSFRKLTRFNKEDRCTYCDEPMDEFVTQGHKCLDCKQLFHTKCIQNGGVKEVPCIPHHGPSGGKPGRRKHRKHSRGPYDIQKSIATSKFSLTGTSEFTDRTDQIISDVHELHLMQDFITQKIHMIDSWEGDKPNEVNQILKLALREFKDNLVATYSVVSKQGAEGLNIQYKDLIANFVNAMKTVCNKEKTREDFPVTMGVNAFRGFMDDFMSKARSEEKPSKAKRKKEKKRKLDEPIIYSGHMFLLTIINIPTACEICTSFFMWPIERGLVCQNCKLTCHKKCYTKASATCGKDGNLNTLSTRVFGVPLSRLALGGGKVPIVVDRLITTIEMYGLYTEGLYRKSGVSSKVKELKAKMDEGNLESIDFNNYQVHVLSAALKSFFREMPEPLLTFDHYDDFLRAASLSEPQDKVVTLFTILKKLPKPNFDLMERLIFHLARVALHEDSNRMNASALAIVFAPCILRTNKPIPAQDSLHDISLQTRCIETIVSEQLRKVRSTLADIDTLDTACHTATHRLSSLRSSKIFSPEEFPPVDNKSDDNKPPSSLDPDDEETILVGHIQEIQKEKELLTSALPSLTRTTSDDDLLSTDMDDGSIDELSMQMEDGEHDITIPHLRKTRCNMQRSLASRSLSSGASEGMDDVDNRNIPSLPIRKAKRQSSSDITNYRGPHFDNDDEDPIMV